jgi:hypothetical protein
MTKVCIPRDTVKARLRQLKTVQIQNEMDKEVRVDIFDITPEHVQKVLQTGKQTPVNDFVKYSKRVQQKLNNALEDVRHFNKLSDNFIKALSFNRAKDIKDDTQTLRDNGLALRELIDAVRGEVDKVYKEGLELENVSSDGQLPNLPLHRVAAMVGRKMLYTRGLRYKKGDKGKYDQHNAAMVETMYYVAGMAAIENLAANGFVKINEANTGHNVIKDFLDDINEEPGFKLRDKVTDEVASLQFNLEALGIDSTPETPSLDLDYFVNRHTAEVRSEKLQALDALLRANHILSVPENVVFPSVDKQYDPVNREDQDTQQLDDVLEATRKELETNPVYIQNDLHNFFTQLHQELKESPEGAADWLRSLNIAPEHLKGLFGLEQRNQVKADQASFDGRQLSKSTPMNDLIEYYERFNTPSPAKLFMGMFTGKNARLYYTNSVLNPHSSKLMRHTLSVDPYTVKSGSPEYAYMLGKVAIELKLEDPDGNPDTDSLTGVDVNSPNSTRLQRALDQYAKFQSADTARKKVYAATKMHKEFPHLDFTALVSTLGAAQDIQDGTPSGEITSTYAVTTDATASGGMLTLLQSLGTQKNSDKIVNLFRQLGLFNGSPDETLAGVNDIYGLLQNSISDTIQGKDDDGPAVSDEDLETRKRALQLVRDELFKGKDRELAKPATMTFIYDQSKGGARNTMAKDMATMLLQNLNKKVVSLGSIELINLFLGTNYTKADLAALRADRNLDKKLRSAIAFSQVMGNSSLPDYLFETLVDKVTEPYLREYKDRADRIFQHIEENPKFDKIRVMPAAWVLDNLDIDITKLAPKDAKKLLEAHGLTMGKEFEVLVETGDWQVLTRPSKNRSTVMNVSYIHGIDTAILYRSLNGLLDKHKSGAVVVHDAIYGSPALVMEAENRYMAETGNVTQNYDIHKAVLDAMAVYDPMVTNESWYTKLYQEVEGTIETKREELDSGNTGINLENSSIIGDGIDLDRINKGSSKSKAKSASKKKVQPKTEPTKKTKPYSKQTVEEVLQTLSEESPLIGDFLNSPYRSDIRKGDKNLFDTASDTVSVSPVDPETGKKLSINTAKGRKRLAELVEHEITHSYTLGVLTAWYKGGKKSKHTNGTNLAYIEKSLKHLKDLSDFDRLPKLSTKTQSRLDYILNQPSQIAAMGEFIAVMNAEPDTAQEIYGTMNRNKNQLMRVIEDFVNKVRRLIAAPTQADLLADNIEINKLYTAINSTVQLGKTVRSQDRNNYREIQTHYKELSGTAEAAAGVTDAIGQVNKAIDYLNVSVARHLSDPAVRKGLSLSKEIHEALAQRFPTYLRAMHKLQRVYDDSDALQSLVHKVSNANVDNAKKNKVLSMFAELRSTKNEVTSKELEKFSDIQSRMSEEDRKLFHKISSSMALHDYFNFVDEDVDWDTQLTSVRALLSKNNQKLLDTIVDMNVHDNVTDNTVYNIDGLGFTGDTAKAAHKYVALRSMEEIGHSKFKRISENAELMDVTRDNTLAHELLLQEGNLPTTDFRDNRLIDQMEEPVEYRVVTLGNLNDFAYEERSGWQVLVQPTKNSLGVVYRKTIDGTYQEGTFTDITLQENDLTVDAKYKNDPRVVKAGEKYKFIIPQKAKRKAGLIQDASQSIVRSMAHTMAIVESEGIRQTLLEKETYWDMKTQDMESLLAAVQDPQRDHPWFLSSIDDKTFNQLPTKVKAAYMPVKNIKKLSNVNSFDQKIEYVRKDLAYWLVGDSRQSLANNKKLQWALRITKDAIAGAKIGMVVTNPVKIAADNMSNITYLGVMGVDPDFIQKNYRQISAEYNEYQKKKNDLNKIRVKAYANPDRYKTQIEKMEEDLRAMPANGFVERGFVSSLGSELVMQTSDPASGFKNDIDTMLKTVLTDRTGKYNKAAELVNKFAKGGNVGVENFLEAFSIPLKTLSSTDIAGTELQRMADRIRHIKNEDDVISYMHQYLNSPDSEFVKLGSHMTDLTDILARETYYRYLVQEKGMAEKDAELEVIDAFPDYKENMPTHIKQMSDLGILMFPTYWLRIQKAIYRMVKGRPVSFSTEMAIEHFMQIDAPTIWDANILDKASSYGGLFHGPWENIGVNSLLPRVLT